MEVNQDLTIPEEDVLEDTEDQTEAEQIGAVAASLRQSHSNLGSEPHLRPTPQLTATPDR